jgi:hypothetical protein
MTDGRDIVDDDSAPRERPANSETLYRVARLAVALAGLFVLSSVASDVFLPEIRSASTPAPPLRDRLPWIIAPGAAGVLMLLPNRWTRRAGLFWPRLALHVGIGACALWLAGTSAAAGWAGGRSWHIFPVSAAFACVGVGVPLCLIWSRRLGSVPAYSVHVGDEAASREQSARRRP